MAVGVIAFFAIMIAGFALLAGDAIEVEGRQTVELVAGSWTVSVPADAPETEVVISRPDGTVLRRLGGPAAAEDQAAGAGEASSPDDPWREVGQFVTSTGGDHVVDAGEGTARLRLFDFSTIVFAGGVVLVAMTAGGLALLAGALITLISVIVRIVA